MSSTRLKIREILQWQVLVFKICVIFREIEQYIAQEWTWE